MGSADTPGIKGSLETLSVNEKRAMLVRLNLEEVNQKLNDVAILAANVCAFIFLTTPCFVKHDLLTNAPHMPSYCTG